MQIDLDALFALLALVFALFSIAALRRRSLWWCVIPAIGVAAPWLWHPPLAHFSNELAVLAIDVLVIGAAFSAASSASARQGKVDVVAEELNLNNQDVAASDWFTSSLRYDNGFVICYTALLCLMTLRIGGPWWVAILPGALDLWENWLLGHKQHSTGCSIAKFVLLGGIGSGLTALFIRHFYLGANPVVTQFSWQPFVGLLLGIVLAMHAGLLRYVGADRLFLMTPPNRTESVPDPHLMKKTGPWWLRQIAVAFSVGMLVAHGSFVGFLLQQRGVETADELMQAWIPFALSVLPFWYALSCAVAAAGLSTVTHAETPADLDKALPTALIRAVLYALGLALAVAGFHGLLLLGCKLAPHFHVAGMHVLAGTLAVWAMLVGLVEVAMTSPRVPFRAFSPGQAFCKLIGGTLAVIGLMIFLWQFYRIGFWGLAAALAFLAVEEHGWLPILGKDERQDLGQPRPAPPSPSPCTTCELPPDNGPLVLLTAPGGAFRSAYWTLALLRELQKATGDAFMERVHLLTGASGGMVGASMLMAFRHQAMAWSDAIKQALNAAGQDCLWDVMERLVLRDVTPLRFVWRNADRARVLLEAFCKVCDPLRDLTFLNLRRTTPHLVLSPTVKEIGAPLVFSNLDLSRVVRPDDPYGKVTAQEWRSFPWADPRNQIDVGLHVAAPAVMNCAFPYLTPAIDLPFVNVPGAIDAGYYDTFGVNLAAQWLLTHQACLQDRKILLVEIRNGPTGDVWQVPSASRFLTWLTTPLYGELHAWSQGQLLRNDALVRELQRRLPHFTRVVFEYCGDASMSWYLTDLDRQDLDAKAAAAPGIGEVVAFLT